MADSNNIGFESSMPAGSLPRRFVEQYLSHLLPALKRIQRQMAEEQSVTKREQAIRFEAYRALALSASTRFRWSRALKESQISFIDHSADRLLQLPRKSIKLHHHYVLGRYAIKSARSRRRAGVRPGNRAENIRRRRRHRKRSFGMLLHRMGFQDTGLAEDTAVESRMQVLRSLTPGGSLMTTDVLLHEVQNYAACLKTQVQILQCLACRVGSNILPE